MNSKEIKIEEGETIEIISPKDEKIITIKYVNDKAIVNIGTQNDI